MGQPIKSPDIEYGTDCPRCVPPFGSRWNTGETPKYIYAMFSGITYCAHSSYNPPNGLIFRMEQLPASVCTWYLQGSVWHVEFIADRISPNFSQLRLGDKDGWSFFTDQQVACPPEFNTFVNDQTSCVLMYAGAGGHGTIWWSDEAIELAVWLGLCPSERLMYEVFPVNSDFLVHKFCDRRNHTNIKIKKS